MPPFLSGLAASLSIATGYFPVAISFGLSAVEAGLAPGIAVLISVLVYAGASQFLLISLLASGAGLCALLLTRRWVKGIAAPTLAGACVYGLCMQWLMG